MKPLPEEADSVCWPKMLVETAEQLMETTLLTVEAYTSAGLISVCPSTFLTLTVAAVRLLCCTVVLPVRLLFWARMAPPKPQAALITAQLRIRATTRPTPPWCFLGCTGVSVTTGSAAGSTVDPAADSA